MITIIGLGGPAGSGKSTVATHLVNKYGAKRYSLAAPLKEICKRTLGFSDEQLYGSQEQKEAIDPRYNFSARQFMQKLGTEGLRAVFGQDVWVNLMMNRIDTERPTLAVCDDVRFLNEALAIRAYTEEAYDGRGLVWLLGERPGASQADATHQSESEWRQLPHDLALGHAETVQGLLDRVDVACHEIGLRP